MFDSRDDLYPDPLDFKDYESDRRELASTMASQLDAGYKPSHLCQMPVPKALGEFRPAHVMSFPDRVAYLTALRPHARLLDGLLPDETYVPGYRVPRRGRYLFKNNKEQWKEYRRLVKRSAMLRSTRVLVKTDIVRYYENIRHADISALLDRVGMDERDIGFTLALLEHWSNGDRQGIPQNLDASSLLANALLADVDHSLIEAGVGFHRWVDDTHLVGNSTEDPTDAVGRFSALLGAYGLKLHGTEKTKVYFRPEMLAYLDERDGEFGAIESAIGAGNIGLGLDQAREILRELVQADGRISELQLRRSIGILGKHRDARGVDLVLENLPRFPHVAADLCKYLATFPGDRRVAERLSDLLEMPELGCWQEAHYARVLIRHRAVPDKFHQLARDRATSHLVDWAPKAYYARALDVSGRESDRDLAADLLPNAVNLTERRALLVSAVRGRRRKMKTEIGRWTTEDPRLRHTAAYLASRPDR